MHCAPYVQNGTGIAKFLAIGRLSNQHAWSSDLSDGIDPILSICTPDGCPNEGSQNVSAVGHLSADELAAPSVPHSSERRRVPFDCGNFTQAADDQIKTAELRSN
jgi:hypothetical protein